MFPVNLEKPHIAYLTEGTRALQMACDFPGTFQMQLLFQLYPLFCETKTRCHEDLKNIQRQPPV